MLPDDYAEKVHVINSTTTHSLPDCDVVLVDEYDKTLENLLLIRPNDDGEYSLGALADIRRAKRIICFSATEMKLWKDVLNLFGIT